MDSNKIPEEIDHDRRRFVGTVVISIAAVGTVSLPANLVAAAESDAIRPFHINVSDEQLADLRRRIAATRWPDRETVDDQSQGVQLAKFVARFEERERRAPITV
jgi:hypothetical protein